MNIPSDAELLASIHAFLVRHGMKPTRFGRDATGEAQLIESIESGRSPSLRVLRRVADFMAERDAALAVAGEATKLNHADRDTSAMGALSPGNAARFTGHRS